MAGGGREGVTRQPVDAGTIAQAQGGFISRVGAAIRDIWMGPGVPQTPVAPQDIPTRDWNFDPGYNFMRTPNSVKHQESGGIEHYQLRALANQAHVRTVIETVKDQQCKKDWVFTVETLDGEGIGAAKKRARNDPRIAIVAKFFKSPDRQHDWADWLRLILEEVLVVDYTPILHRPWMFGATREPFSLEVIDPDLIRPFIDATGRQPLPPIAAYEQWIQNVSAKHFSAPVDRSDPIAVSDLANVATSRLEELLVVRRNPLVKRLYGFSPTEQLLFYINLIMRRDLTKLAHYTEGNIPAGLLPCPPDWNPKQIAEFQNFLDVKLSGNPAERSRLIAVPGGGRQVDWAQNQIMQDAFDDAWVRLVCFAFGVSTTALVAQHNRATAETSKTQAEEDGSASMTDFVRRLMNTIIRVWFGWSDIVAVPQEDRENDPVKQSLIDDQRSKNGTMLVEEIRERDGLDPLGLPPGLITANGYVPFEASIGSAMSGAKAAENIASGKTQAPPPFGTSAKPEADAVDAEDGGPVAKSVKKNFNYAARTSSPNTNRN